MKPWNTMEFHCVRVLKDFGNVKEGQLGGWIEKEDNLSHDRNCWVYEDEKVYDFAEVSGSVQASGYAQVFGNAALHCIGQIKDNIKITTNYHKLLYK